MAYTLPMDPASLLNEMRIAYKNSLKEGAGFWQRLSTSVDSGELEAATLGEVAIKALETMGDDDPTSLGMSACDALRVHGSGTLVERLRAVRPGLPPRRGLRDWRVDADRALEVIEARAKGVCTCSAEASRGAPVYGNQWKVESESTDRERYCVIFEVRCTLCGTRWRVRREDSYHYPISSWTRTT